MDGDRYEKDRERMVWVLRDRYRVRDERVLDAMGRVRRHLYIPERFHGGEDPYGDHPCQIGYGQTISQPYIVAHVAELLAVKSGDRILDVGSGSGYQSAVLAELGAMVSGLEIVPELVAHARSVLQAEGYGNVQIFQGDGYLGLAEQGPFDSIAAGCAPEDIPPALVEQLKDGGKLVIPVGPHGSQQIIVATMEDGRVVRKDDIHVRFVPMVRKI